MSNEEPKEALDTENIKNRKQFGLAWKALLSILYVLLEKKCVIRLTHIFITLH